MRKETGGVGLQLNPTMLFDLGMEAMKGIQYDFGELLCDMFAGPLDSGYVIDPGMRPLLDRLSAEGPLIAHGNYGNEFGFEPLDETPGVLRHIAISHEMKSPWYADHMFYGSRASAYMWSQPLQFSRAEIERVAGRAAALQDRLKMPLLHENAFYYAPFPGSEMAEAEFIAGVVDRAQTYLLLDLHNVYANSVNFNAGRGAASGALPRGAADAGAPSNGERAASPAAPAAAYDPWQYLRTLPLDRVVEIHLAGGQWLDGWYHDLHNNPVPGPVWEMLDYVLRRAPNLRAVCLEVQGPGHTSRSCPVKPDWVDMINADLQRARDLWAAARGGAAA
ncbi:DUF692 domain-containing protein [Sorangium sp. So ce542]|uniref:DUF692 domain-containing protein n=1 Tax=Sorangium sp. So ce542 TaxID=3133316 RepID=UPI003F633773